MKVAYKPLSMLVSVIGGVLAGVLFKQLWRLTAGEDDAPEATDRDHSWGEVLTAAALQGAIFAFVKAAMDRSGAVGIQKLTGRWPGKEG